MCGLLRARALPTLGRVIMFLCTFELTPCLASCDNTELTGVECCSIHVLNYCVQLEFVQNFISLFVIGAHCMFGFGVHQKMYPKTI